MKKHKHRYPKYFSLLDKRELKRNVLKYMRFNIFLNNQLRQKAYLVLIINFSFLNFNRLKIYCLSTGRTNYVLKKFKVSRLAFKKIINLGYNCGYFRGSW